MSERKSVVNGHFYPNTKEEIEEFIKAFNKQSFKCEFKNIKAIIVPHAGYIYSGFTANSAYKLASSQNYKRIVVIGPSHRVPFEGASVSTYESYQTPLKNLKIDEEFAQKLKEDFAFTGFNDACHKEHSTETQMPFVAHYFPDTKVVEIVYSKLDFKELAKLVDSVLHEEQTLLVISTDLSHFHELKKANELDNICIEAIKNRDINTLEKGCEACGMTGVKALLQVCEKNGLNSQILNYTTSAERSKDESSVVGYVSAVFGV